MRYSLSDFTNYFESFKHSSNFKLSEETNNKLQVIIEQVGSPEYSKAPQFKNKLFTNNNLKKKKNNFIFDEEWDTIKNFQTTELVKKEGLDLNIDKIRKSHNMLTNNNFTAVLNNIKGEFSFVFVNKTLSDFNTLCNSFYEIICSNLLYINLSGKLFTNISSDYPVLITLVNTKIKTCKELLNNIKYMDPDLDYEMFCIFNKKNEKIRTEFNFFASLYNEKLISEKDFNIFVLEIFDTLQEFINMGCKKNEVDEISEITYLVISNSYYNFNKNSSSNLELIIKKIKQLTNLNIKTTPGITNKCIFKHMDLLDDIKVNS